MWQNCYLEPFHTSDINDIKFKIIALTKGNEILSGNLLHQYEIKILHFYCLVCPSLGIQS